MTLGYMLFGGIVMVSILTAIVVYVSVNHFN